VAIMAAADMAAAARAIIFATVGGSGLDIYAGGGGGGGSFNGGTSQFLEGNIHPGNGEVLITEMGGSGASPVPEPSTWVTMATGFAALGLAGPATTSEGAIPAKAIKPRAPRIKRPSQSAARA
jgi:hypothetical protein